MARNLLFRTEIRSASLTLGLLRRQTSGPSKLRNINQRTLNHRLPFTTLTKVRARRSLLSAGSAAAGLVNFKAIGHGCCSTPFARFTLPRVMAYSRKKCRGVLWGRPELSYTSVLNQRNMSLPKRETIDCCTSQIPFDTGLCLLCLQLWGRIAYGSVKFTSLGFCPLSSHK